MSIETRQVQQNPCSDVTQQQGQGVGQWTECRMNFLKGKFQRKPRLIKNKQLSIEV